MSNETSRGAAQCTSPWWRSREEDELLAIAEDIAKGELTMSIVTKPLNKRAPAMLPESLLEDYTKMSKSDLMDVLVVWGQLLFGEESSAEDIMDEIKKERELQKAQRTK